VAVLVKLARGRWGARLQAKFVRYPTKLVVANWSMAVRWMKSEIVNSRISTTTRATLRALAWDLSRDRSLANGSRGSYPDRPKRFNISSRTVEKHRSSVLRKLNIQSWRELVRYAIRDKMVEP
jgi:Bacterial regulatory proteins, luxR family